MKTSNKTMLQHIILPALTALFAALLVMMSAGSTYAADENAYIFGTAREASTFAAGEFLNDSFYYSDQWFREDPAAPNNALALLSMQLSAAAVDDQEDGTGAELLKQMGFSDIQFKGFHSEDPDDMAYTCAVKTTGEGEDQMTIVAVVVQSYSFDNAIKKKGWTQNFRVNGSEADGTKGEHYALSVAAGTAMDDIAKLSEGKTGPVKYWIMGHSRGGALAGLVAAKLKTLFTGEKPDVYAYTFESPATVQPAEGQDVENDYDYIHNYLCSDDIVPMVPPAAWGMTRYGKTYQVNTEEANAGMAAELEKLGSQIKAPDSFDDNGNKAEEILNTLLSSIPDRASYSKVNQNSFTTLDGQAMTIEYSYQEQFMRLMGIVFGEGIEVPGVADHLDEILVSLDPYIRGYMAEIGKFKVSGDIPAYYYQAANDLCAKLDALDGETGNFPLETQDVYVLLKLAAPLAIDTNLAAGALTQKTLSGNEVMMCLFPAITMLMDTTPLTFSHQFDTVLARLKVLAPAPQLEDISIDLPEPKAGDSTSKLARDAKNYTENQGLNWLDISAKWDTDDLHLKNNRKYYLVVTLYAAGHSASEAPKVTIGGKEPVGTPEVSSKEGLTVVKAAFAYEFGTPAQYQVDFENDYGKVPAALTVSAGTILKYEEKPDAGTRKGYEFSDWYCWNEPWEDVVVLNDKTFTAEWVKLISEVTVSFDQPRAGQKLGSIRTPAKASYHVEQAVLENAVGLEVETVKKKQSLTLRFQIVPNAGSAKFAEEDGEFAGTVKVNGKTAEFNYDEEEKCIYVTSHFTVKGKVNPLTLKGKTAKVKLRKLKKKAQKLTISKVVTFKKNAKDKKSYKLVSVKKGGKSFKKYFKLAKSTGKLTIKKNKKMKKGTYIVKFRIKALGNTTYEPSAWKTVSVKVRVK